VQGTGLTTFAAVFMLVSMGSVTLLMVWCFYRIMTEPGHGGPTDGDPGSGPTGAAGDRS
jgi:hypothetical protein